YLHPVSLFRAVFDGQFLLPHVHVRHAARPQGAHDDRAIRPDADWTEQNRQLHPVQLSPHRQLLSRRLRALSDSRYGFLEKEEIRRAAAVGGKAINGTADKHPFPHSSVSLA